MSRIDEKVVAIHMESLAYLLLGYYNADKNFRRETQPLLLLILDKLRELVEKDFDCSASAELSNYIIAFSKTAIVTGNEK